MGISKIDRRMRSIYHSYTFTTYISDYKSRCHEHCLVVIVVVVVVVVVVVQQLLGEVSMQRNVHMAR